VLDPQPSAGSAKALGAIPGAVVGEDAADRDAHAPVVTYQSRKEAAAAQASLVSIELAVGHARMVVDRHVQELIASALGLPEAIAGQSVTGAPEARKPLDVQVNHISWMRVLIALHRGLGIQRLEPVQPAALKMTRHRT